MRMSSGAGFPSEKPRSASSNCIDETPKIEEHAVDRRDRAPVEDVVEFPKVGMNEGKARIGNRSAARALPRRIGIERDQVARCQAASRIAREWPPAPNVASTYIPSGRIARYSIAGLESTGT